MKKIAKVKTPEEEAKERKETGDTLEKLMNRIVAKKNFVNDSKMNTKIEKIFNQRIFQKIVDNAEVMQDISNVSISISEINKPRMLDEL